MGLEPRALETVGLVEILAARLDMILAPDLTADLGRVNKPSLIISTFDDATIP